MLLNNFIFDHFKFFNYLKPLSLAGDYEMPVKILNELIKHNYSGFPNERMSLEKIIAAQLKDQNYSVDKTMSLAHKLMAIPGVTTASFCLKILKGLRARGEWEHFKKIC